MMEPDFDDDDLINDYVEEYEEPAMDEYDEALFEEMMGESAPSAAAVAAVAPATPMAPTQLFQTTQESPSEEEEEEVQEENNVSHYIARQTNDSHLYNFERYQKKADWRQTPLSPNSNKMAKAKEWKTKNHLLHNKPTTTTRSPAAHLLQLLHSRNAPVPKMKLSKKHIFTSPLEGEPRQPMTLGDGSRVYVRLQSTRSTSSTTTTTTTESIDTNGSCSLGVSMKELKRRSDVIRRRQGKQASLLIRAATTSTVDSSLWVDKHAPHSFPHLLSCERTNREVLRALRAWDPYVFGKDPPSRPASYYQPETSVDPNPTKNPNDKRPDEQNRVLLLSGPPGVGKTTLAHIVARHAGYRPLEVNGSDERSASVLTDRVRRAMESTTLLNSGKDSGKPNCLILDEIDGADAKGAIQALVEIIKEDIPLKTQKQKKPYLRRPIIFICNHKYAPALRPLLPYARHFQVDPPLATRLVSRLKNVLQKEKLPMMAGGSLLHQLVVSTGGDIRSSLYTLQFAAVQAKDSKDLSQALATSLGGSGLKDDRTDISATISTVFRKVKSSRISSLVSGDDRASVTRVLDAVEALGDNSATINSLFMNLPRLSYIDPTLDRCAAAHEWLSGADLFRSGKLSSHDTMQQYSMQRLHTPSVAGAIHLLCRVERIPDLSFSTRELSDAQYQREANLGLVHKFMEGLPAKAKMLKCQDLLSTEILPMVLWILSAQGSLLRAVSSMDVLTKPEKLSVDVHVAILRSLGLTYVADQQEQPMAVSSSIMRPKDSFRDNSATTTIMRIEPPIDRLVDYAHLKVPGGFHRKEIPTAMKELIAQQVHLEGFRQRDGKDAAAASPVQRTKPEKSPTGVEQVPNSLAEKSPITPRKIDALAAAVPPPKRSKTSHSPSAAANFLGMGARKAKEAKSARRAAAVGLERSKKIKMAHTGSGLLLSQVIRLKYIKGFTQAVRTPCNLEDLK